MTDTCVDFVFKFTVPEAKQTRYEAIIAEQLRISKTSRER